MTDPTTVLDRDAAAEQIAANIKDRAHYVIGIPPQLITTAATRLAVVGKGKIYVDYGAGTVFTIDGLVTAADVITTFPLPAATVVAVIPKTVHARRIRRALGEKFPEDGSKDLVLLGDDGEGRMLWPSILIAALDLVDPEFTTPIKRQDRDIRYTRAERMAGAVEEILSEAARETGARTNRDLIESMFPGFLPSYDDASNTVAFAQLGGPGTLYPASVPEFVMELSRQWVVALCAGEGLCQHLAAQGFGRTCVLPGMLAAWERPPVMRCLNCPDRPELDPIEERTCDVCRTVVDEITPIRGAINAMFVVYGACAECAKLTINVQRKDDRE